MLTTDEMKRINDLRNMDKHDHKTKIKKPKKSKNINFNKNSNNGQNDKTTSNNNAEENKFINVMYANADSLTNKIDELETYAKIYKADLILVTEHLSKNPSSNFSNIYKLEGYTCLENNVGRGVCVFYNNKLDIKEHDNINEMFSPSIFFNIKTKSKPLNIGLIYRSPNSDNSTNKKVNNQIKFASKKLKNLVIFGDFNHPSIDWEHNYCKKNEEHCDSQFLYEIIKMNTNQLITSNTHLKPNCKPSLIDLILTKTPEIINSIKHNPPLAKSHHHVITAKLKINDKYFRNEKSKNKEKIIKPNFDKANFDGINFYLQEVDWDTLLKDKNVDDMWTLIKNHIYKAQELFVPNKTINNNKIKANHIAMDDTLHFLLKEKRYLFKFYKKYNTKSAMYKYNYARNRVSAKIKHMKMSKENKIAKNIKDNPKAFYQYIASKTITKEGVYELINKEGKLTNDDTEKCNIVNEFFSSVFTNEDTTNLPNFDFKENDQFLIVVISP